MPCVQAGDEDCFSDGFSAQISDLPAVGPPAGFFIMQVGKWPPYTELFVRSVAANAASLTVYFLTLGTGAQHPTPPDGTRACGNCVWLQLNISGLASRVSFLLGGGRSVFDGADATDKWLPSKMGDLRVFGASLFPRLARRHQWVGWLDYDMVLGTGLTREILSLAPQHHDLLYAGDRPPCNGNFFLMRSAAGVSDAWRLTTIWRDVLQDQRQMRFDEWWGPNANKSLCVVYQRLIKAGRIRPKTLVLKPLLDDELVARGAFFLPPKTRHEAAASDVAWHEYEVRWSDEGRVTAMYSSGNRSCRCTTRALKCHNSATRQPIREPTECAYFHFLRFKRANSSWWRPQRSGRTTTDSLWTSCGGGDSRR